MRSHARAAAGAAVLVALLAGCATAPPPPPVQLRAAEANRRGLAHLRGGDAARARAAFEEALRLMQSVEDERGIARGWYNLSVAYQRLGRADEADRALDAVLLDDVHAFPGDVLADVALRKAVLATARGDLDAATRALARARGACGTPCGREGAMLNLDAHLALARGRPADALALLTVATSRNRDDPAEAANTARLQAAALVALGRMDEATVAAGVALAADKQLARSDKIEEDLLLLASAAPTPQARRAYLMRAADVARARGDDAAAQRIRARLGLQEPPSNAVPGASP